MSLDFLTQDSVTLGAAPASRTSFTTLLAVGPSTELALWTGVKSFTSAASITSDLDLSAGFRSDLLKLYGHDSNKPAEILAVARTAPSAEEGEFHIGEHATPTTNLPEGDYSIRLHSTSGPVTFSITVGAAVSQTAGAISLDALISAHAEFSTSRTDDVITVTGLAGLPLKPVLAYPGGGEISFIKTAAANCIESDLIAANAANDSWFMAGWIGDHSDQDIRSAADFLSAYTDRMYIGQTDSADFSQSPAVDTDMASILDGEDQNRMVLVYREADEGDALALSWAAQKLSADPDRKKTNWAWYDVPGFSTEEHTNQSIIIGKNVNVFTLRRAKGTDGAMWPGKVVSGRFIDEIIMRLWIKQRIRENIYQLFGDYSDANLDIPFDSDGFGIAASTILGTIELGYGGNSDPLRPGWFRDGSAEVITPALSDYTADEIASGVAVFEWRVKPKGALRYIGTITGRIAVEFPA